MWRGSREGSVNLGGRVIKEGECGEVVERGVLSIGIFRGVEALSFCQVEISTILKLSLTHNSYHNS